MKASCPPAENGNDTPGLVQILLTFIVKQICNENGENDQLGDMVIGLASKEMYCTSYEN